MSLHDHDFIRLCLYRSYAYVASFACTFGIQTVTEYKYIYNDIYIYICIIDIYICIVVYIYI